MLSYYFFMVISTSLLLRTTTENINHTPKQHTLFTKQLSYRIVACFSVMYDFRHKQYTGCTSIATMMRLLLVLSGIKSYPCRAKYPCGECNKVICYRKSTSYENSNKWYHESCTEMRSKVYDCYTENSKLEWEWCNFTIKNIIVFPCLTMQ